MKYFCFTEKGEDDLPSKEQLSNLINEGFEPTVFIDSCVCLHIVKIVDYGKNATGIKKEKLINLKEYITRNNIKVNPLFGLIELCNRNGVFDEEKFYDFKKRIDFFTTIPLKTFKRLEYNFARDFIAIEVNNRNKFNPFAGIETYFLNTYCILLKIREISLKSLNKKSAQTNIFELLSWMENELNIILSIEYSLALNIFGGSTEYRKMIGLDSNPDDSKKKIIGTTWDIIHSRFCTNNYMFNRIMGGNVFAFFLTSDTNLFKLISHFSLFSIFDKGENMPSTFFYNRDFNLPHYDSAFLDKQNEIMLELLTERNNNKYIYDKEKILSLIKQLELKNNIA